MKVLILGSNGMLGHKLYQVLSPLCEITGTVRGPFSDIARYGFFQPSQIVPDVDCRDIARVESVIEETRPNAVVNCVGVVKQLEKDKGVLLSIWLNSLFPHQLYHVCQAKGVRLIHISTDCVFSGRKGRYREDDASDAEDVYGKTKHLGEVTGPGALTLRTSFIARELASSNGLLEWFLSNRGGRVQGFTNAIFSGFTSLHLSRIIADVIRNHPNLSGLYHVSSEPISKFDLLTLINRAMKLNIEIEEFPGFHCDRSLDSSRFRKETGFAAPSWEQMIDELARDAGQYLKWR